MTPSLSGTLLVLWHLFLQVFVWHELTWSFCAQVHQGKFRAQRLACNYKVPKFFISLLYFLPAWSLLLLFYYDKIHCLPFLFVTLFENQWVSTNISWLEFWSKSYMIFGYMRMYVCANVFVHVFCCVLDIRYQIGLKNTHKLNNMPKCFKFTWLK